MYELDVVHIRLVKERGIFSEEMIDSPQKATRVLADEMAQYDREVVALLNLTTSNQVINVNIVSMGTINASLITPREVFKSSILSNAASIMLYHNHPSGRLVPSKEDLAMTDLLYQCGQLMGILLMDHLIVAGRSGRVYSMKEEGLLDGHAYETWNRRQQIKRKEEQL